MQMSTQKMAGGRSLDKNYGQLSGHIPKRKIKAFKIAVTTQETTIAEAMEQAIDLWLAAVEAGNELPPVDERFDKRRSDT